LTAENFEVKDDSKSPKSLEAPQGCFQRTVRSFVKTVYSESVFHMILLSLRCKKGVYPCWETLGIKKPLIWRHYNKAASFFTKTSNQRQAPHVNFGCQ
jgi:hypothetical protein